MKKFLDFTQYHFTGITHIKVFKTYVSFARLSPYFTLAFLLFGLGDMYNVLPVFIIGCAAMLYCIFCFFFLRIFKSRQHNSLTRL